MDFIQYLNSMLSRKINFDFRWLVIFVSILFFSLILYINNYCGGYQIALKNFGILSVPYFVDLRILLCGIEAMRIGFDPYEYICFGGIAYYNYPRSWYLFTYFPFMKLENLFFIGFSLIGFFYCSIIFFIGKITFRDSLIYILVLCSPAVLLGLERGNSDLIVFIFCLVATSKNFRFNFILITLVTLLKIYPLGAILSFINKDVKAKYLLRYLLSFAILIIIYVFYNYNDLLTVSIKTPRPFWEHSYGLAALPLMVFKYIGYYKTLIFMIFIGLNLIFSVLMFRKLWIYVNGLPISQSSHGQSYLVGSAIFVVSFLIGSNWEYRLVFLILTIPQLLIWFRLRQALLSKIVLFLLLITFWQSAISNKLIEFHFIYYPIISAIFHLLLFNLFLLIIVVNIVRYIKENFEGNVSIKSVFNIS